MKQLFKRIAAIATAALLTLGCAAFAACGDKTDETTYTIKVALPDAVTGVEGVGVEYKLDGEVVKSGTTNESGILALSLESANYTVQLSGIPSGYAVQSSDVNTQTKTWGSTTYLFVLAEVRSKELSLTNAMTDTERNEFAAATKGNNFDLIALGIDGAFSKGTVRKSYSFTETVSAETTQAYSFRADQTGEYYLFAAFGQGEVKLYNDQSLKDSVNEFSSKSQTAYFMCNKGQTYYFTFTAGSSEETVQFVIATPEEKNTTDYTMHSDSTKISLTIQENLPATLLFTPTEAGTYTFTIATSGSFRIEERSSVINSVIGTSTNGAYTVRMYRSMIYTTTGDLSGLYVTLCFYAADSANYPVEIEVNIVRSDLVEQEVSLSYPTVKEKLTQYGAQSGTLTAIGVVNSNSSVVKGTDGLYHYGSENGPVVVIKLKGAIAPFYPETNFEELDKDGGNSYGFSNPDIEDTETTSYRVNYSRFLRGYHADENEAGRFEEFYLKYVNDDGVYPLTDELKVFLTLFSKDNALWFKSMVSAATDDSLWLFSAFYYAN